MVATTATMIAGTAAATANIVTMRSCRPDPACPRKRDCTSSMASVTTSATTSSTSRPLATQISVQTSGVGSMLVAPVMIRNEPEATSTDSTTTIRPTARSAWRPRWLNSDRELGADGFGGFRNVPAGQCCVAHVTDRFPECRKEGVS